MSEGAPPFTGVGVALITVFDESLAVDVAATADHAVRLVGLGVQAVVVAGSTGEAMALTPDERDQLVATVRAQVPSHVPVVAGTGAPTAAGAVELTRRATASGADAVLVLSPPFATDPLPYYEEVAAVAGRVPVLAYHFPAVSTPGIRLDRLSELPVAGVKDSSGDPDRLLAELTSYDGAVYVGSAALLALAGPAGCTGAILALANADPERCIAAFGGDGEAQRTLAPDHLTAQRRFPAGIKQLVSDRFGLPGTSRLG